MTNRVPQDRDGWVILSARLLERRLKETGLSQVQLARRLGATQSYATISAKVARGTFPAGFLIQAFAATGATCIELPAGDDERSSEAVRAADPGTSGKGDPHLEPEPLRAGADGVAVPSTDAGWQALAAEMVEATLARSGVTRAELFWRLRRMNVHLGAKELGQRLRRGNYQAYFMLQVLVAAGCAQIKLPLAPQ